jgi:hypothetical protein
LNPLVELASKVKVPLSINISSIEFWKSTGCKLDRNGYEDLRFAIFNSRMETFNALKTVIDESKSKPEYYGSIPN